MRRALAAVVLGLGLVSCGEGAPTEDYELAGFVTIAGTEEGVRGATVIFTSDTLYRSEARTNGDGYYEMPVTSDTPLGQVRAEHPEFQTVESSVFFDTRTRRVDLVTRPL